MHAGRAFPRPQAFPRIRPPESIRQPPARSRPVRSWPIMADRCRAGSEPYRNGTGTSVLPKLPAGLGPGRAQKPPRMKKIRPPAAESTRHPATYRTANRRIPPQVADPTAFPRDSTARLAASQLKKSSVRSDRTLHRKRQTPEISARSDRTPRTAVLGTPQSRTSS